MKQHLLSALSILTLSITINAQNVNIPDANFKAYLVSNIVLNTNSDTEIQVSEAAAYNNQLNCSSLNITDLTGIEAFTAMTSLHCEDNLLTKLDVSACSALLYLYCQDNLLTSLNFSPAIRELACTNNQLTSIDLSANIDFTILFCNNNLLTSLNVANGNNQIVNPNGFNTTGNPNLTCIEVDDAYFSLDNWWYIDTWTSYSIDCNSGFGCTVTIPDINFKNYLVGNTAINTNLDTEIQCSEATSYTGTINCSSMSVASLTGIEAFTSLSYLNCQNNTLTSLDVSNNTVLITLNCMMNQITNLNFSSTITILQCTYNQLTSLDVSSNTGLTILGCGDNLLTTLNAKNGNNTNISNGFFTTNNNPSLTCIEVDNAAYSTANWTNIDAASSFSEDCDGLSTNNNTNIMEAINIFPNPAIDLINIESDNQIESVTIFNHIGSLVQTESTNSFSVAKLPVGIYTISIKTDKGFSVNKFIKQ